MDSIEFSPYSELLFVVTLQTSQLRSRQGGGKSQNDLIESTDLGCFQAIIFGIIENYSI